MERIFMALVLVFFVLSGLTSASVEAKGRVRPRPDSKIRTVCPPAPCCETECDCNVESSFDGVATIDHFVRQEAKSAWRTCALKQIEEVEKRLSRPLGCYENPDTGYESAMTWIRDRCGGDNALPARTRAEFQRTNREARKCVRVRLGNGLWGLNCP